MSAPLPLFPRWLRWLAVGAIAVFIFYTSIVVVPPEVAVQDQDVFGLLTDLVGFAADKWAHFFAYGTLSYALAYATDHWALDRRRLVIVVVGSCLAYGVAIEVSQSFLAYRTFAVGDLVANAVGAALVLPWFAVRPRLELAPVSECFARWRELVS